MYQVKKFAALKRGFIMNEPERTTKEELLNRIIDLAEKFDSLPIAKGTRYVWNPYVRRMIKVIVK